MHGGHHGTLRFAQTQKTNFPERKKSPGQGRNGRGLRYGAGCHAPKMRPTSPLLGRINGHVTETVHYFFYCGLTGPPIQKNPTPTPMDLDAAAGLGGVVR